MSQYTIKNYDTLVSDMASWIVAHAPQISDLTPGSVLRGIVEGVALGLEEIYVTGYLGFQRELAVMPQTVFNFARKSGTAATTTVVFSGPTAPGGGTTIPSGTRVKTASGLVFTTDTTATIPVGTTTSNSVAVTSDGTGVAYNVGAGEITIVADAISGVNAVTNANAASQGTDAESDYAWMERFQEYIEGLGRANIAGCLKIARDYTGITSASYVEHVPAVANVDAHIYIDNGTISGVTAEVVAAVQELIDGDGTQANPGARALGVNVKVAAPTIVTQNFTMSIWLNIGADGASVETDIGTRITAYVNSLGVGETLIQKRIEAIVMDTFGVLDCTITLPTSNVIVSQSQVVRVGSITVNIQ